MPIQLPEVLQERGTFKNKQQNFTGLIACCTLINRKFEGGEICYSRSFAHRTIWMELDQIAMAGKKGVERSAFEKKSPGIGRSPDGRTNRRTFFGTSTIFY